MVTVPDGFWEALRERLEKIERSNSPPVPPPVETPEPHFRPPTIRPIIIRSITEEQSIILDNIGGRGNKFDTWDDVRFSAASVEDITGTIIPFIQNYMFMTWAIDFSDCNTFADFQAAASRMWFRVTCCHAVRDRWANPPHSYTIWLPSDNNLYVCEPNPKESRGAFFTKWQAFAPSPMYTLKNVVIK